MLELLFIFDLLWVHCGKWSLISYHCKWCFKPHVLILWNSKMVLHPLVRARCKGWGHGFKTPCIFVWLPKKKKKKWNCKMASWNRPLISKAIQVVLTYFSCNFCCLFLMHFFIPVGHSNKPWFLRDMCHISKHLKHLMFVSLCVY